MGQESVDFLIIGAGASGAAIAWSLSQANLNILCLEQGDWMRPDQYPSTKPDWERHRFDQFSADPNVRNRPEDYPINAKESPITPLNFNAVGGSTIKYMGRFPRFHPSDFRVRTLDGVADDWPIDYKTLEPYYTINDRITGVSSLAGNPAYPPRSGTLPPVPLDKIGHKMAKGFNKLGWHWWPAEAAILTQTYEGREACMNAGPCDLGCAKGAKASTDITYWPLALRRRGVKLKTHCRVREITVNNEGLANGVLYYDENGQLQKQAAEVVVLACSGIGTPRLLLNSQSKLFPEGLANRSGLVGKNLMLHPLALAVGLFDEPLDDFKGPIACCISSHEFYETDPSHDFKRGYMLVTGRGGGALTAALGGLAGNNPIPWGKNHRAALDHYFGRTAGVCVVGEDLPEAHNQVTLDPELTDSDGIPAPKVTYR